MTFQNKKILVAGLGGTGISMIAYLRKNGAEVAAYDAELKPERVTQIGKMFDGLVFTRVEIGLSVACVILGFPSYFK